MASLAFSLAYRTHFKHKLGIKAGAQFFTAETRITQSFPVQYPGGSYDYGYLSKNSSTGTGGNT